MGHTMATFLVDGDGDHLNYAAYAITAILAYIVGSLVWSYQKLQETKKHLPPAPPNYGFVEYLTQLLSTKGPQFALKISREIGYIYRTPGLPNIMKNLTWVCVSEPNLARSILEDSQSQKPVEAYIFFDRSASGKSFFTSNGKRANHVRKSTASAFSAQNVKRMATVVEMVLNRWIEERLEPLYVQTGKAVNFDEEMMIVTTDVIASAAFDYELTDQQRFDFTNKMRKLMEVFFHQNLNLRKKFFGFLFAEIREARRLALELKETFGHEFLKACRENPNPSPGNIVHLMLNDDDYADDEERARDIMVYFFAGFETTAHMIAWAMLELAKNPEEQKILRTALGEFAKTGENGEKVDMKLCPHVKMITREVLRLHPAVALGSPRMIAKEIKVANPENKNETWIIPKNSYCNVMSYVVMRNHHVFGENVDEFVPSRWESPTEDMQKAYLPFSAGKRNCQGMALAYLELHAIIARVAVNYELEVENEGTSSYMVTLRPEGCTIFVRKL